MEEKHITASTLQNDIKKATALIDRAIDLTEKGQLINLSSLRTHIRQICNHAREAQASHKNDIANLLFALDAKLCDFNTALSTRFGWLNNDNPAQAAAQIQDNS